MERHQDNHQLSKKNKALKMLNPGKAYKSLRLHKQEIIDAWEEWVRQEVEPASRQDTIIVRDHLSVWLDQLVKTLNPRNPGRAINHGNKISQETGLHRAVTPGYSLQALLKEYSLLRKTICMILEEDEPLDLSEREIINEALDTALSLAASEFSAFQQSQLKMALQESERSNRDLEHFAAIAAHDLKSPLATTLGYLEIVQKKIEDQAPDTLQILEVAVQQPKRMLALIDRLLEFAKLRAQKPAFVEVDLSDVANVAIQNLKATIENRKAAVHHEQLPKIQGDISLLTQLFQNLIGNGIKFNQSPMPEVSIRCRSKDDRWILEFEDNGIGFDPKERHSIFEPYKRLHKGEFQGSGLGLATVQRVVEVHHGSILANSQPGKGSVFTVELPKRESASPGAYAESSV